MAEQDSPKPADAAAQGVASQTDASKAEASKAEAGGAPLELDELTVGPEAAASEDDDAAADAVDPKDAEIAELRSELSATKDQLMRAIADVQNAHKRAEREKKDAETYGGLRLARDILVVFDNLTAALDSAGDELQAREAEFFNGLLLTQRNMLQAFEKHGIKPIGPQPGEKFDPNRHQAMFEMPTPEHAPGTVAQLIQVGFMISDRLLRPALVGVAKAPDGTAD